MLKGTGIGGMWKRQADVTSLKRGDLDIDWNASYEGEPTVEPIDISSKTIGDRLDSFLNTTLYDIFGSEKDKANPDYRPGIIGRMDIKKAAGLAVMGFLAWNIYQSADSIEDKVRKNILLEDLRGHQIDDVSYTKESPIDYRI